MFLPSLRSTLQRFVVAPARDLWQPPAGQLGALDFLRTCAVLMVILFHLREAYLLHGGEASLLTRLPLVKYGIFGVDLFFVLSGYLIGKQLWKELATSGTIHIPRFLVRRGLRIWPLYYAFIALNAILLLPSHYRHSNATWWSDALYLSNYTNSGIVDGSWSLCTEEQFYLLLPLLLLAASSIVLLRERSWWLWALLALLPVIRVAEWRIGTGDFGQHNEFFVKYMSFPIHVRCDGLFAGVLVAYYETRRRTQFARSWLASPWLVLFALVLGGALCAWQRWIFCFAAASWVFAATTANLIARPGLLQWFFSNRLFFWLSRLSFGMYLNHMYLFVPVARWTLANLPGAHSQPLLHFLAAELLLVIVSAGIAIITYALIEHPFLALRDVWLQQSKQKQAEEVRKKEADSPDAEPALNSAT